MVQEQGKEVAASAEKASQDILVRSAIGIETGTLNLSPDQRRRAPDTDFAEAVHNPSVRIH